ncbi:MAG: hypothetical protein QM664_10100 [Flavihumibacter sp.]
MYCWLRIFLVAGLLSGRFWAAAQAPLLIKNAFVIDVDRGAVKQADILIRNGKIAAVGRSLQGAAQQIDAKGKYILPGLFSNHVHIGTLKGNSIQPENYTRENIIRQLEQYKRYGILHVLSMGTDQPLLFQNGWYDSLRNGYLPGAQMLSAGYGFSVTGGAPGSGFPMQHLFRPENVSAVPAALDSLQQLNTRFVKIWVDNAGPSAPKMSPKYIRRL